MSEYTANVGVATSKAGTRSVSLVFQLPDGSMAVSVIVPPQTARQLATLISDTADQCEARVTIPGAIPISALKKGD